MLGMYDIYHVNQFGVLACENWQIMTKHKVNVKPFVNVKKMEILMAVEEKLKDHQSCYDSYWGRHECLHISLTDKGNMARLKWSFSNKNVLELGDWGDELLCVHRRVAELQHKQS